MMADVQAVSAFSAFENQLKTLCLQEFPCGIGRWKENYGKKRKQIEKDKVNSRFVVTLKEYGAKHDKTETLEELVISKDSPWNLDYSWSNEAKELREIAVRSPWLIDDRFVHRHFKTLQIVDKNVTEVDEDFLRFTELEELSLTANRIRTVNSSNLPGSLKVLELCANDISTLADLCMRPPHDLRHLGLGYNSITLVDEYITGFYWPNLLSLDLSHNNLCDLMDIVRKLQTIPKLRNLILQGNPLTLIPGYRGYTIDSLRKLSYLDDISISADEKHHYKGLAKRKEFILDEAKVVLHVSYIKGVPMPEEMKNPEEQPEFPVVTRKYFVQFMYPEDKVKDAEIFEIIHDDEMSEGSPSMRDTQNPNKGVTPSMNTARTSEGAPLPQDDVAEDVKNAEQGEDTDVPVFTLTAPTEGGPADQRPGSQRTTVTQSEHEGTQPDDGQPQMLLAPVNSASSEWQEDIQLNWIKTVARDDLLMCRDFLKQGMQISVMEEKTESFPADQFQNEEGASPTPSSKSVKKDAKKPDKKDDKAKDKGKDDKATKKDDKARDKRKESADKATRKDDKNKDKEKRMTSADKAKAADKGGDKKAKKKGEPEIDMVSMPPEYRTLCTFHVPLADFLDGEYEFENVYSYSGLSQVGSQTPASEISSKNKGKDKDKKKPGSGKKKDQKSDKEKTALQIPQKGRNSNAEVRVKSGKKDDKKDKKDDKPKGKDGKSDGEEEVSTPPPPLEIHVKVKLSHWKTAMDSMKEEEGSEEPEEAAES